jgi:GT2 family glycosyltransferase
VSKFGSLAVATVRFGDPCPTFDFLNRHAEEFSEHAVRVGVSDNGPNRADKLTAKAEVSGGFRVIHLPENPGYFPAAFLALEDIVDFDTEWMVICNPDIEFDAGSMVDFLSKRVSSRPEVIGPSILQGPTGQQKNPDMPSRPSAWWFFSRAATMSTRLGYEIFMALHRLRSIRAKESPRVWPAGRYYSIHGSFIILNSAAFEILKTTSSSARLYTEEVWLGESCLENAIPIHYEPALQVHHIGHLTTRTVPANRMSQIQRAAYFRMLRMRLFRPDS